jgi:RHS repeat-associated protein
VAKRLRNSGRLGAQSLNPDVSTASRSLALVFFAIALSVSSQGQNYLTSTGTPAFSAPDSTTFGFVDASNGNLHLEIPLGSYPQRGTDQPLRALFVYDANKLWTATFTGSGEAWTPDLYGGWGGLQGGPQLLTGTFGGVVDGNNVFCPVDYSYIEPSGTQHLFPPLSLGDACGAGTADIFAADSSGYHLYVNCSTSTCTNNVYAPDGTMVYGDTTTKDPNGNYIRAVDPNGNYISSTSQYIGGNQLYVDTLGRKLGTFSTLPNSQGANSSFAVTWDYITVKSNFKQSGIADGTFTYVQVPQSITLPDSTKVTFKFDCDSTTGIAACGSPGGQSAYYGSLISMTLPSGGTDTYGWNVISDPYSNKHLWLGSRQSGGNTTAYSHFNLSTCSSSQVNCQQQTLIARPTGDHTLYTFTLNNGSWPVQVQYNWGGTDVTTVNTTYDFSVACPWSGCHGAAYVRKLSETTTVPVPNSVGNVTKKTTYSYVNYQNGLVSAVKEWGFYAGTSPTFPAVPDRATYFTYLSTGTNNINRPTSVTKCNNSGTDSACGGSGTRVSQTLTTYDQYGTGGPTLVSGASNHDDTNFGTSNYARGNPTTVQHWVSGSTYLSTTMTYDTTGQLTSLTDPLQHVTQYSYGDKFFNDNGLTPPASYSPTAITNAYVTKVTLPGVSNPVVYGYYYGTGQEALETDVNLQTSYSHYVDLFNRPTGHLFPIGWDITTYASDTQIDTYEPVGDTLPSTSCVSCRHNQHLYDNLGRESSETLVNAPGCTNGIEIDTIYDSDGRVGQRSHSYCGKSDSNYVFETYGYDALDRIVSTTHPDNESLVTHYGTSVITYGGLPSQQGSTTTYGYGQPLLKIDESGKMKQEWVDGFGHVIEVDEPGSGTTQYGSATITVSGNEQTYIWYPCYPATSCPTTGYDNGTVTVTVNGHSATYYYGQNDTATSVANGLLSQLNGSTSSVTASLLSGACCVIFIQTKNPVATMYTYSTSSATNVPQYMSGPSFWATPSSGTMTPMITSPVATFYTYDALGNLTHVYQGSQSRTYQYDGLSRRTSVSTPEAATDTIYYTTAGGSLCSGDPTDPCRRTDARGITTTYTYDGLNRMTGKSYSDGTGSVTYTYDQGGTGAYALTRLTKMTDPSGSESYTYDKMGRVTALQKVVGSATYTTSVNFDVAGDVTQLTYPSGHKVQQSYDNIGRLCEVAVSTSGCNTSASPYATAYTFLPPGTVHTFKYGNGVTASFGFSAARSQMTAITYVKGSTTLFGVNYWFQKDATNCPSGTAANNGQINCITDAVDSGRSVSYGYDTVRRLVSAVTQGSTNYPKWGLAWTYDQYSNRTAQTVTAGSGYTSSLTFDPATNRPNGYTFDASGDLTIESIGTTNYNYSYDAEDRMTGVSGGASATYTYDGNGTRVKKAVSGGTTTVYVFAQGKDIAEYDNGASVGSPTREYVYSEDMLISTLSGGSTTYSHSDGLSVRLNTDGSGNVIGQQGHFPFGESWYSANTTTKFLFTSYERDSETGLDYALARYYDNRMGRFCSPDPAEGSADDPQSWNRYTYVRNDPTDAKDPSGKFLELLFLLLDEFVIHVDVWAPAIQVATEASTLAGTLSTAALGTAAAAAPAVAATATPKDMLNQAKQDVKQNLKKKPCASHFNNVSAMEDQVDKTSFKNLGKIRYKSIPGGITPENGTAPLAHEFAQPYTTALGQTYTYPVVQLNSAVNWVDPNNTAALLNGKPFAAPILNGSANYVGAAAMTPQQLMDLTIFHEMSHTKQFGRMDPDLQKNQQKLWKDCIN